MSTVREVVSFVPFAGRWVCFVVGYVLPNRIVELEASDGSVIRERWSRREQYEAGRPLWQGLLRDQPCGCRTRLGRPVYYTLDCREHWPEGAAS